VAGGRTTSGDDRRAGGPIDGRWPRVDDADWRRAGSLGRTRGHRRTTPARGTRAAEDGRLETRGWPRTGGQPRVDDGGWPEEARATVAGARQPSRQRSRRPV
jgi:hypothetical protein